MASASDALVVHSLTEASLYLMLVPCGACGGSAVPNIAQARQDQDAARLVVPTVCRKCHHDGEVRFDLSGVDTTERAGGLVGWAALAQAGQAPPINRSEKCSRVLDVAGWMMLAGRLSEAARVKMSPDAPATDRTAGRQMLIQAGECLDEALKFYEADNDLPPADAFFTDAGKRQFREQPERFLRQQILGLRAKLPVIRVRE